MASLAMTDSGLSTGTYYGIAVGAVAVALLLLVVVYVVVKRRRAQQNEVQSVVAKSTPTKKNCVKINFFFFVDVWLIFWNKFHFFVFLSHFCVLVILIFFFFCFFKTTPKILGWICVA